MLADIITLSAQTDSAKFYRHEFSSNIGFGTLSGNRWDAFREQMEERFALSFKHGYAHTITPLGIRLGPRYMYSFNKHISIGGQFSYFSGSLDYDHYTKEESVEIAPSVFRIENREYDNSPSIRAKSFSVMPAIKWLYSRFFYLRGGIGFQYRKYSLNASTIDSSVSLPIKDEQWLFAYQFVPFGAEFSLPSDELSILLFNKVSPIYFHVELGYGMEGIFNVGLAYKFSRCKSK
jgi:hypothetical protein